MDLKSETKGHFSKPGWAEDVMKMVACWVTGWRASLGKTTQMLEFDNMERARRVERDFHDPRRKLKEKEK